MMGVAVITILHWDLSMRLKKVKKAFFRFWHRCASSTTVTRNSWPYRVEGPCLANDASCLGDSVGCILSASRMASKSDCAACKKRGGSGG